MHCYICDRETDSFKKDFDGRYVSICSECRESIRECNKIYKDVDEDDVDIKLLSMSSLDLIKYIDKELNNASDVGTKRVKS